jgi:hypothetical protein
MTTGQSRLAAGRYIQKSPSVPAFPQFPGTNIGNVSTLDDAVAALNPTEKTIIRVRP